MTAKYRFPFIRFPFILAVAFMYSCGSEVKPPNPLEAALASQNPKIKKVMDSIDRYEVQIRYTQIDRRNDRVFFTDHDFQIDADNYFYPASTVKFPIAVLSLEKLNQNRNLSMYSRFYIEGDSIETTFANDVSKVFAVSDNDANNRLFEFLGQDAINRGLLDKGISPVRISHRLSVPDADRVTTNPLVAYLNDSTTTILYSSINKPTQPLELKHIQKGTGFYDGDSLVHAPFDFSLKNYYPIDAQHSVLKRIIFPENFTEKEQFGLSLEQRLFLLAAMQALPREVGYNAEEYYDSYGKFFIFGDTKENIPEHIKIYNKVGYAYGTLTDCAYITDTKNNVEFLLTATILVNKDGVFNNDNYEYDDIGIPFLAELGRQLYTHELKRKKRDK